MPLRLVNKSRTYPVIIEGTTFHVMSMSISDKERLMYDFQNISKWMQENPTKSVSERFMSLLASAIVKIDGFDASPFDTLMQIEDLAQLRTIVDAVKNHCNLNEAESKNSASSSEQFTPEPARNVEKPVNPEVVPVSTIVKMD